LDKKSLRHKYKSLRKALSQEEFQSKQKQVLNHTLSYILASEAKVIHSFIAISKLSELQIELIFEPLWDAGKTIVVSVSDFKTSSLRHFILEAGTELRESSFGIKEPVKAKEISASELDLVLVPLLAADIAGNRVGYGKGFYDRFLSDLSPQAESIGLSLFDLESDLISDIHPNDIPLNLFINPEGVVNLPW
jgi:5-formyltetrahydrofolate cyclo-ligase